MANNCKVPRGVYLGSENDKSPLERLKSRVPEDAWKEHKLRMDKLGLNLAIDLEVPTEANLQNDMEGKDV